MVTDVDDLVRVALGELDYPLEKASRRLGYTLFTRRSQIIDRQFQSPQELRSPHSLVTGDADPHAAPAQLGQSRTDVGVEVVFVDLFANAGLFATLALGDSTEAHQF